MSSKHKIKKKKSAWKRIRKFFNDVHLWLGLASGLVVIVVCFSGTAWVFNAELIEWASPHLYKVDNPSGIDAMSPDMLLSKLDEQVDGKIFRISVPADPAKSYQVNVRPEGDKSRGGVGYFINQYTGEILGNNKEESAMRTFMGNMFSLHRWLLLDKVEKPLVKGKTNLEVGRMITGWATIIFTLGCLTGIIIWFPNRAKSWRQGLKVKWKAGWKRLNHDLHNTLAFYSLFFLLIMGLTGPQWSFEWYRTGLQKTLGTYKPKAEKKDSRDTKELPVLYTETLTVEEFVRIANAEFAYSGDYTINLPGEDSEEVNISKSKIGFFAPAASDRLTLNKATGAVIKKDVFREKPFNERVAGSIKALHIGTVYGGFSKWIYFIACLIATSLPVTGTLIWLNKLKKKRRKATSRKLVQQEPQYA